MAERNLILDLTFKFSLDSIAFSEVLEEKKKFNMARQYWRSSTSIGASVRESPGAESKNDFCHKLKIAYKEAEESEYWLLLCKSSPSYPYREVAKSSFGNKEGVREDYCRDEEKCVNE